MAEAQTQPGPITCSEEQAQLLDIAGKWCADQAPIARVRGWLEDDTGPVPELWPAVTELGWTAVGIPEEHGGIGLGPAELAAVLEPMGQHLLSLPLLETHLVAQALLVAGSDAQQAEWLPAIAAGTLAVPALHGTTGDARPDGSGATLHTDGERLRLSGTRTQVADLPAAGLVLVLADDQGTPALVLLTPDDIPEGQRRRETGIDAGRRTWSIDLHGIEVPAERRLPGDTAAALAWLERLALLGLAADACGAAEGCLQVILGYLDTRVQFGRKIGAYQALKHPTVDIMTGLDQARSFLWHAATAMSAAPDGDAQAQETAVRMAKAQAEATLLFAGDRGVQFHGGFGFTWECDAGLYLRRGLWCQSQWGDARLQRKWLAALLFD